MAVLVILDHLHRLHHLHHLLTKMTKITHPPGIGKNADLDYQDYVLSCLPTTITKMTATLLNVPSVYRLTKITKITVILLGMTVPFCRHIAAVSLFMPGLVEVRNSNGPDNHGVSDSRTICGLPNALDSCRYRLYGTQGHGSGMAVTFPRSQASLLYCELAAQVYSSSFFPCNPKSSEPGLAM